MSKFTKAGAIITRSVAVAAMLVVGAAQSNAQEYPERDITMVIPFPPGGGTDLVMREIAKHVSESTAHQMIVDNRPGAGGSVAAMLVRAAKPDGYTLLFGNASTHAINPWIMNVAYDPIEDFVPVTEIMSFPHVLLVPSSSEVQTVADLIAKAEEKTDGLSFATQGLGSGGQLLGEQLRLATGAKMVAIPYQGGGPALLDTSTGRTDFMFSGVSPALPMIDDGSLRVIAVTGSERLPDFPDVPSLGELGYPEVNKEFWFAVFAPAGTPDAVTDKLRELIADAIQSPSVANVMKTSVATPLMGDGAALAARVEAELNEMEVLTREAGIAKK